MTTEEKKTRTTTKNMTVGELKQTLGTYKDTAEVAVRRGQIVVQESIAVRTETTEEETKTNG